MEGCKEIYQRQTEMEKARRPMFQQELEELRSRVRSNQLKRIALELDHEYPLRQSIHLSMLYKHINVVSKRDQTGDIHLSGLST